MTTPYIYYTSLCLVERQFSDIRLVVWNPFMAMNTNTFHFCLQNMNTFTPWEKSIWAQYLTELNDSHQILHVSADMCLFPNLIIYVIHLK